MFKNYLNMLQDKIPIFFKHRRTNKIHKSAKKIFVSRVEFKHINTKLTTILYIYNKQKSSIENIIRKILTLTRIEKRLGKKQKSIKIHKNRLISLQKKTYFFLKEWNNTFFIKTDNFYKYCRYNIKINFTRYDFIKFKKIMQFYGLATNIFDNAISIVFNNSKFNNLSLNLRGLGITSLIEKIYGKDVIIKIIELRSIHLNSDNFSSAIALKLRDRMNKAVRILRKAIFKTVKIPDFHTLITFNPSIKNINKNNILNVMKQQVVSGVRLEAAGRLTRRLTASRSIFKVKYMGSLKDIDSSFKNKSSSILRGHVKSNAQYTVVESKTRNGTFGLKV
jgi:hypothetical protein